MWLIILANPFAINNHTGLTNFFVRESSDVSGDDASAGKSPSKTDFRDGFIWAEAVIIVGQRYWEVKVRVSISADRY